LLSWDAGGLWRGQTGGGTGAGNERTAKGFGCQCGDYMTGTTSYGVVEKANRAKEEKERSSSYPTSGGKRKEGAKI